jgi:hypothetical protein
MYVRPSDDLHKIIDVWNSLPTRRAVRLHPPLAHRFAIVKPFQLGLGTDEEHSPHSATRRDVRPRPLPGAWGVRWSLALGQGQRYNAAVHS